MQGVAELFPVSSLGHSVLCRRLSADPGSRPQRPHAGVAVLAFIVGLHVATAIALLVYFWRD